MRLAVTLASTAALALAAPAASQAGFTSPYTTKCSGSTALGISTGLQSNVGQRWKFEFEDEDITSPLSCAGTGVNVLYRFSATSSEALEALGSADGQRSPAFRFAGNEEPPTLSQWLKIDGGAMAESDPGLIRQIPAASTAIVPLVHFPQGCSIPAKEATSDGRFTISNSLLEQAFAGKIGTWGQLLPDIQSSCASIPLQRVVPAQPEGTAFVFKQWLGTVDPKLGWPESSSLANTAWPNDSGATATLRAEGGDEEEAATVARTSATIGFASLPQARSFNFGVFSSENPLHDIQEGLFWLSVVNGAGQRSEPTRDPRSGADNVKGANCDNPQLNYVPAGYDTTITPIWRIVSAAGSRTGWPICTLTYDLAWDDSSTVYGAGSEEQAKQRTVKDYLAYVLSPAGQNEAANEDYSRLPASLLADAQDGQSRVGWNKIPGSKSSATRSQIVAAGQHTSR
jgi:ABC-type phosphate transport system substrate-binding protein